MITNSYRIWYKLLVIVVLSMALVRDVSAGPVILGGDDLTDHGFVSNGVNQGGWLYIQRALGNIRPAVTRRGHDGSIAALGSSPSPGSGDAGDAIGSAAAAAGLGLTVNFFNGANAINQFFTDLRNGAVNPAIIWTAGTGAPNDLDSSEGAALTNNAQAIADFVNSGGGLLSHGSGVDAYGWLETLIPGLNEVDGCNANGATLTAAGQAAFPGLSNSNIDGRAGPCHSHFEGNLRTLAVLATDGNGLNYIIGGGGMTIIAGQIALTPPSANNLINTNHTVTANVRDGTTPFGPIVGTQVTFSVTAGPNVGDNGTNTTDANGNATFTYTGDSGVGIDTIQATFVDRNSGTKTSNLVTKTWFTATVGGRSPDTEDCSNGRDDDDDRLIDCKDPDCKFFVVCIEDCRDGIDNDQDGLIDCNDRDCFLDRACDKPPVVTITSPSDGSVVSGTINITAVVTDDVGFRNINFFRDGSNTNSFLLANPSYSGAWDTTAGSDGIHDIMVTALDTIGQSGSDEIIVIVDNVAGLPEKLMAPVFGKFHIDTGAQTLPPDNWSFWQHKLESLRHSRGGGVGAANDTFAWDMNLASATDAGVVDIDADRGRAVFSVATGIVEGTYAGCANAGGNSGQVLINHGGWWSGYVHLGGISVKTGDIVNQNTQLGVISNTGADNNHLHFVVYVGKNLTRCEINPLKGGLESFNAGFKERNAWPMFRHDLQRTGRSPFAGKGFDNPIKALFSAGGVIDSSVALGFDGALFFGSFDKRFYSLALDGRLNWSLSLDGGEIVSSPAFGGDSTIFVGTNKGSLFALDVKGSRKWDFKTGGPVPSSPLVTPSGLICFGSWDRKLYCLNNQGVKQWEFETGGSIFSSPALSPDGTQLYIGSLDGNLYALDLKGKELWKFKTGSFIRSSAAVDDDGTIYFASWDGKLYAVNANGMKVWEFKLGDISDASPAIFKGDSAGTTLVFVGDNKGTFHAVKKSTGMELWNFKTNGAIKSSAMVDKDGRIYFGSEDKNLYVLDKDGNLITKLETGGIIHASPILNSSGNVLFGAGDGVLYSTDKSPSTGGMGSSSRKVIKPLIDITSKGRKDKTLRISPERFDFQKTRGKEIRTVPSPVF